MAFVLADRVKETSTTTGTGTLTLGGAASGFQSFNSGVGDGNSTCYAIKDANGTGWEVGIGTYTNSGTTLSRTTVLSSSNSGSAITLSAGTHDVFVTDPANKSTLFDQLFGSTVGAFLKRGASVWSAALPGSGLFDGVKSSTIPTSSGTGYSTWVNQGSVAVADNPSGILLSIASGNSSAHAIRGRSKAIPTPPFTETFLLGVDAPLSFSGAGVGWYDGTKADTMTYQSDGLFHTTWTNTGSGTFTVFHNEITSQNSHQIWFRLKDDNAGNITAQYSLNGEYWTTMFTSTKTAGFLGVSGYTNLIWFIDNYSQPVGAVMQSWSLGA